MSIANMKVTELKALARERGLKRYSKLRKAELINLLNGDAPVVSRPVQAARPAAPRTIRKNALFEGLLARKQAEVKEVKPHATPVPRPVPTQTNILDTKVPNINVEPMKPIPFLKKITDIPQIVKTKTNSWYNWLVDYVPEPIKQKASKAFQTFKDTINDLYKQVVPRKEEDEYKIHKVRENYNQKS